MSDELKPCSTCGGKAEIISGVGFFCVSCSFCCGETNLYNTKQDAIYAWNKRAQPTFTTDQLDAIRRNVRDLRAERELSKIEQAILDKCDDALKGGEG